VIEQFGASGAVGIGSLAPAGPGKQRVEQEFHSPDTPPWREAHDSIEEGPDQHRTASFDWADGAWQPRRSYVWRRITTASAAADRFFVAHFTVGPAWDKDKPPNQQQHFAAHSANLKKLRGEGRLLVGARYADKGMVVVKAATREEAEALFAGDPSLAAEVFQLQLDELRPFYPGTIGTP
jgi:uncharacterized protein YciI